MIAECLVELEDEKTQFMNFLSSIALVVRESKDCRGWGNTGSYKTADGYRVFSAFPNAINNLVIWKNLWNSPTLPKIDLFCWTMVHGRLLTGDNLEKCGFEGSFRCPLCCGSSETILYLFFSCPYARDVWDQITTPWFNKIETRDNA